MLRFSTANKPWRERLQYKRYCINQQQSFNYTSVGFPVLHVTHTIYVIKVRDKPGENYWAVVHHRNGKKPKTEWMGWKG